MPGWGIKLTRKIWIYFNEPYEFCFVFFFFATKVRKKNPYFSEFSLQSFWIIFQNKYSKQSSPSTSNFQPSNWTWYFFSIIFLFRRFRFIFPTHWTISNKFQENGLRVRKSMNLVVITVIISNSFGDRPIGFYLPISKSKFPKQNHKFMVRIKFRYELGRSSFFSFFSNFFYNAFNFHLNYFWLRTSPTSGFLQH